NISESLAEDVLTDEEAAMFAALSPRDQRERFVEHWTLKEAYAKARSLGLAIPFDRFCFRYPNEGAVELTMDLSLKDDPAHWQFWQFRPSPRHVVAVCAERPYESHSSLIFRESIPGVGEKLVFPDLLRSSAHRP
ncbi:MAG TPA: 4'-phosphopantetheinyl transferase superfamily protein, partial [Gammaproteobacteria bacterium]|nr:4'-phosphopantetheinyl transferase superfamily protein [Gammaproteobacteria bacterium]